MNIYKRHNKHNLQDNIINRIQITVTNQFLFDKVLPQQIAKFSCGWDKWNHKCTNKYTVLKHQHSKNPVQHEVFEILDGEG